MACYPTDARNACNTPITTFFGRKAHSEPVYDENCEYDHDVYDVLNNDFDLPYTDTHCICDKSLPLHYAIVSNILPLQEYIFFPNYHCGFCYNQIVENKHKEISFEDVKQIYYANPIELLFEKNWCGHTPLDLIYIFLKIMNFEHNCPYLKARTHGELCVADYELYKIVSFLTKEKSKFDILCCASKFSVQLPKEMWDNIFEYL